MLPPERGYWCPFYANLLRFGQRFVALVFDDTVDALALFDPFLDDDEEKQDNDRALATFPAHSPASLSPGSNRPYWPRLQRLRIRNSYMLKSPYLRAVSRTAALVSANRLVLAIGRAATHMPALEKARVCQCVVGSQGVEWLILTYQFCAGIATLKVRGFIPNRRVLNVWKSSVASTRGVKLKIHMTGNDSL